MPLYGTPLLKKGTNVVIRSPKNFMYLRISHLLDKNLTLLNLIFNGSQY